MVGHQPARDACVERADQERQQLVLEEADPDHLSSDVAVANRDERASDLGANQVLGGERRRDYEGKDEVEDAGIRIQGQPEDRDGRWGDEKPQDAVGHTFPVNDHVSRDEVRGQCGNGEIQALEPQRGEAKQQAKRRRQERRRRDGEIKWEPDLRLQGCGCVGSDCQECRMPDGDLAGIPDQDIES